MVKSKVKRKRAPESVLKLPDLEQSKSAVLNGLTSPSSQRTYDHAIREFIEWYCSEPRLAQPSAKESVRKKVLRGNPYNGGANNCA
jgi:hypothetical protein